MNWRAAWAKSDRGNRTVPDESATTKWLPLHTHLKDAAEIARLICHEWVGAGPLAVIAEDVGSEAAACDIVCLAAGFHDVGKLTRAFAGQVPDMRTHMEANGFRFGIGSDGSDARLLPHGIAGHLIVEELLLDLGSDREIARSFAVIAGGHHGVPPDRAQISGPAVRKDLLGDSEWEQARRGLLKHVLDEAGLHQGLSLAMTVRLSDASQALITALVIMADWIASNQRLFPLVPRFDDVTESSRTRAVRAWKSLGLPRPWAPPVVADTIDPNKLLHQRFPKTRSFEANDVQRLAVRAALEMTEPGLLIIEAVMGAGKTEASLLAAEILAAKFHRSGVFYALPTRATSDAMFLRILEWMTQVPDRSGSPAKSVTLRHGTAGMNADFLAVPRQWKSGQEATSIFGHPRDIAGVAIDEPCVSSGRGARPRSIQAMVHTWTSDRKRAALADFCVATIDHGLLSALRARHVVLRHLGLARQVVVLDEVHAVDVWMSVYLERAVEWLGRYQVPVIALSATLPPGLRDALLQAYERGRRQTPVVLAMSPSPIRSDPLAGLRSTTPTTADDDPPMPTSPATDAYPLLTVLSGGCVSSHEGASSARNLDVAVNWLTGDDFDSTTALLADRLAGGGCALVVRNTVGRAVDLYHHLRGVFGERVSLAHSRYIVADRLRIDGALRRDFGPPEQDSYGAPISGASRDGRIVVATQVAEQSLDVDFDLLISDLAPIDVLLQRMGRLHRHDRRDRPSRVRSPQCWITGMTTGVVPVPHPGSVLVYGTHLLLRSAAVVSDLTSDTPLRLPTDVPKLVARVYSDEPVGPDDWQEKMAEAAREADIRRRTTENAARAYRLDQPGKPDLVGWLRHQVGEVDSGPEGAKQVREDDGGFEVILLENSADGLRLPGNSDGDRPIPTDLQPDRQTVQAIMGCLVRVPGWVTNRPEDVDAIFRDLNRRFFSAWQKDPVLGDQVVLAVDERGSGTLGRFRVHYDAVEGLEVTSPV
jgi:CRISPR-associated helicase Cas3/CRISPR-associated endonuclease Cas3-HD